MKLFLGRLAAVASVLALASAVLAGCKLNAVDRKPPAPAPVSTIAFVMDGQHDPFLFNTGVKHAQLGATAGKGWEVFLVLNPMGADQFYNALMAGNGAHYNVVLNGRVIGGDTLDNRWPRGYARVKGDMSLEEANELIGILGTAGVAVPN